MCDQNRSTPSWLARNNIMVACPFCGSSDTVVDALATDQLIIGCMTKWNERADLTVRRDAAA